MTPYDPTNGAKKPRFFTKSLRKGAIKHRPNPFSDSFRGHPLGSSVNTARIQSYAGGTGSGEWGLRKVSSERWGGGAGDVQRRTVIDGATRAMTCMEIGEQFVGSR